MSSKWDNFINSFADRSSFSKLSELSTGVLYGGTITSDYTVNKVDIEAGIGQLLIKEENCEYVRQFSWETIINYEITDVGIYEYTIIYVDRYGAIKQRKTLLTDEELESNILLGIVFHIDNIKVNQIINQKTVPLDTPGRVINFLRKLGLMRMDGLSIEPNVASLKVDRSEGTIFGLGVNYYSGSTNVDELYLSGETFCNIQYVYKDGSGDFIYDNNGGLLYTDVDPNFYDNGTGILQALGANEWTVQRCYLFPENPSELVIYYGQYKYTSYEETRTSLEFEAFEEDGITKKAAVFLGYIIVKNGTTDLSDLNDCKILQSGFTRNLPIGGGVDTSSAINYYEYTYVSSATYNATITDEVIGVDSSVTSITITLPDSVTSGKKRYEIKDIGLNSYTNNIIITTTGADTIISTVNSNSVTLATDGGALIIFNTGTGVWIQM